MPEDHWEQYENFELKGVLNEPLAGHVIEFSDGRVEGLVTDPNAPDPGAPIFETSLNILIEHTCQLELAFLEWASDAFTS